MTDRPLDRIRIVGIELDCFIGINEWERLAKQKIEIDVTLHADIERAGQTDDINDAINYASVGHRIVSEIGGSSFGLVESLAQAVATICLEDPRARRVDVSVRKRGAVRFADYFEVEITRFRSR